MALPPAAAGRLVKLLGMTSSAHDGEALTAVRKANELVRTARLTWVDVIAVERQDQEHEPGKWREPTCWQDAVWVCLSLDDPPLSDWDYRFLRGISARDDLTLKQQAQLARIVAECRAFACAEANP